MREADRVGEGGAVARRGLGVVAAVWVNNHSDEPAAAPPPEKELPSDPCPSTADGEPVRRTEYTNKAPAFTGPAPHRLDLVVAGDVEQAQGYNEAAGHTGIGQGYGTDDRGLPVEWTADYPEMPQLVVCEYVASIGNPVQTCEYVGAGTATLVSAVYRYRVIEARTSKPVTEFSLASGAPCPSSIELWGEDAAVPPRMLESAVFTDLENALRPTVAP